MSTSNSRAAFAIAPERQDGEILSVGQQCSAVQQKCTVVDYLPFSCDHCKKRFCQDHRTPESHSCEKWDASAADRRALECPLCSELIAIPPGEDPNIKLGRHVDESCVVMTGKAAKKSTTPTCARARCGKPLWQPITCDKCRKQFCAPHRYPKDHQCISLSSPTPSFTSNSTSQKQSNPLANISSQTSVKSAAAMAALKRSFGATNLGNSSSSPSSAPPSPQRVQTKSAPSMNASTSTSSAVSSGSSASIKRKIPISSKDRPEIPTLLHSAPILASASAATDNDTSNPTPGGITLTSSTSSPTGRCAPTFSFLDADAFKPPPLFGRA
ncbi:hypothetical protein ACEPAH_9043 [Sanghuangporus vaninii]